MSKEELDLLSVRVKFFASSREIIGKNEIILRLKNRTTVGDLRRMIFEMYPELSSKKIPFVIAVNHKVADDSTIIGHLDEVALLPPVSGG
ncbi:MAG: molybdopterin converting factor subunit 1 [Nitrososphaerales archaeon]